MRNAALLALSASLLVGCGEPSPPPPPEIPFAEVADVKQLMQMVIDPAADAVWESVGWIITEDGTEEIYPRNDAEWAAVRNAALVLAESGNLLMVGDRSEGVGPWTIMSGAMIEAGRAAFDAASAQDTEQVFELGEQIYDSCETCHVLYWYDEEGRIPETDAPQ